MAALNFPNSPSVNDIHTENGVSFKWNGTIWKKVGASYLDTTNLNVTGIGTIAGNFHVGGVLTYEDVKNVDSVGVITARSGIDCNGTLEVSSTSNFDGAVQIADTILHLGDTNTKIRFPAADTISFETSGTQRLDISSSGHLKIGTAAAAGGRLYFESTSGAAQYIASGGTNNGDLLVANSAGEKLRITSAGDLALGHTSAARGPLHIHRASADCYFHMTNSTTGTTSSDGFTLHQGGVETLLNNREAGNMRFYTSAAERLRITSAGLVGINNTPSTAQLVVKNSNDSSLNSIDVYNDNGNVSTSISQDSTGAGSFLQKENGGTIKTFIKSYGDSYFTGGGLIIGNSAATFNSPAPGLCIEKNDNAVGPLINLYNAAAAQSGATCEIRACQNYRDANRIIFGRENANNWQSSAAGAASYMGFWTNTAGNLAERLRIRSDGKMDINGSGTAPKANYALLNLGYSGTGETRGLDIYGGWSTGESKSINFPHGTNTADLVGSFDCKHNGGSNGSSLRWGRLYHLGNSSTYPMTLDSINTTTARLNLDGASPHINGHNYMESADFHYGGNGIVAGRDIQLSTRYNTNTSLISAANTGTGSGTRITFNKAVYVLVCMSQDADGNTDSGYWSVELRRSGSIEGLHLMRKTNEWDMFTFQQAISVPANGYLHIRFKDTSGWTSMDQGSWSHYTFLVWQNV